MTEKQRAEAAVEGLKLKYPDAVCSLSYRDPLQLLIATRLSAQCTDARVNMVTPALFERYPDAQAFARADVEDVAELIKSCGLYKTKARDIVAMCRMITEEFGGAVPEKMEDLTRLPGVGRKTANLIRGDVYHKPAIVTDTHLIRLANRLGLVSTTDPRRVETALIPLIPPDESSDFCHRAVMFGREICTSRRARCGDCPIAECCARVGV